MENSKKPILSFVIGLLFLIIGISYTLMMLFIHSNIQGMIGVQFFTCIGAGFISYNFVRRKMNVIKSIIFSISIFFLLFGIMVGCSAGLTTGRLYPFLSSSSIFILPSIAVIAGVLVHQKDTSSE